MRSKPNDWLKQLADPPAAYRSVPFWAWNAKLDKKELVLEASYNLAPYGLMGEAYVAIERRSCS